jgi:hypothetical protein
MVRGVNWTRFVVRASILGAIVTAVAVFFAVGFRKLSPPGAAVPAESATAR